MAEYLEGRHPLSEFSKIAPPFIKLGIAGDSQVGKTTLINRFRWKIPPKLATEQLHFYVLPIESNRTPYIAVLDGAGQAHSQQRKLSEHSNILFILFDHNASHIDNEINLQRIEEHKKFSKDLRDHLRQCRVRIEHLCLVLNKKDLWLQANEQSLKSLEELLNGEKNLWQESGIAAEVTTHKHSNEKQDDISKLMSKILDCLGGHY